MAPAQALLKRAWSYTTLSTAHPPTLPSAGILSMIIIRTLRKDIANYNKEDDIVRGLAWG